MAGIKDFLINTWEKLPWKSVRDNAVKTANTGGEAVGNTAEALKNMAVGTGKGAGIAAGGIGGFVNRVAKGIANVFLKAANVGFTLIRTFPRISAVAVAFVSATGIVAWWKRRKIEQSQEQEAMNLQASIAANKAARVETSAEMGQGGAFPLRNDWGQRVKGGLPGQRTTT